MAPTAYVIGGPNGAGKTTFAREFLPAYADCNIFINADMIAQGLYPSLPKLKPSGPDVSCSKKSLPTSAPRL